MENGGKRKRIGLSLKSFKKPALNYVNKQQSTGNCLGKGSSNKDKLNSRCKKSLLAVEEQIEAPISESR